jgi:RNA polymerase sigma-70 factor (ECF subfamily)
LVATRNIQALSDTDLIARYLRDQNTRYFSELYRRYAGKVFAKCISMLSDEGLARDAMQDIFIKVLLNLSRFSAQSTFSTWVYSITYNYCIDLIRKKKKLQMVYTEDVGKLSKETDEDVPDSVLLEMKQERLKMVMQNLPPGDKAILMMKYIDDLSIKDIAEVLNKTESAIKMQIMRAKQKSQQIYSELYANDPIEDMTGPSIDEQLSLQKPDDNDPF